MSHRPAPCLSTAPGGSTLALHAKGLTRRFGSFTAVEALDLEVARGEIFGFLGANGAGKTTAIRMFCGLLAPSAGEAWVDRLPVSSRPEEVKRRIGYMSQRFGLYEDLAVGENLQFYGGIYGLPPDDLRQRGDELLARLDLTDWRTARTGALPLGFKQRLALGVALLHRPPILFLDEPTGGVDPVARRRFWDLIYEVADEGATVLVTTHFMEEAEYCGRVSIMVEGRLAALGTPAGLKEQWGAASMQELFLRVVAA
ncbi:MAG: ABC transporter ATP-binding protein [bacterium]|nr:ABC transporter ATP-binding protein [bacterium]